MGASSTRVNLAGGAYAARDVIAEAQSCINLFGERNPPDAPVPITYYPTPGLAQIAATPSGKCRGLYVSSAGLLFGVFGAVLTQFDANGGLVTVGSLLSPTNQPDPFTGPVKMLDNGIVLVIVNGSTEGWTVTLANNGTPAGPPVLINDPAWQGSATVAILDTFFVFHVPNSAQFYLSPSNYAGNSTQLDPLYVANKTAYPDNISAVATVAQVLWIIGLHVTELWYDAGAADFPFARTPGVLIPYGTGSAQSVATIGGQIFFLAQDTHGTCQVVMGEQFTVHRVSTHALEYLWSSYTDTAQAIGCAYQWGGHVFYLLTFPVTDITWCYDATAGEWHQRSSQDAAGVAHAWNGTYVVSFPAMLTENPTFVPYGTLVAGNQAAGGYYSVQATLGTDNGQAITRTRGFPHFMSNGVRGIYRRFAVDLDTYGNSDATFTVSLSFDRGQSWGASYTLTVDNTSNDFPSLFRLGMSRDYVFKVTWTDPDISALNGAFVWVDASKS